MKTSVPLAVFMLAVVFLAGCADVNFAQESAELCERGISGFWWGLLHGCIAPFSFIGSLFDTEIAIYDVCNNGGWYDFGFCLGIGAFSGGSMTSADRTRRKKGKVLEIDVNVEVSEKEA